jgi:hypothetical protein
VDEEGYPVQPWSLSCADCEPFLLKSDHWAPTIEEIPATFDEQRAAERFKVRGAAEQQALLTAAVAQLAGFTRAEMPESLRKMMSALPAHVPAQIVCPQGHAQSPGNRFCGMCGSAMSQPVPIAAVTAGGAA